jgi:hypothetical protein
MRLPWAKITSCPNSLSNRLTQGECIPVSNTIWLSGMPLGEDQP